MKLAPEMSWPPRHKDITRSLEEWDAWYSGDGVRLDSIYRARVRPSQLRGGLVGAGARMLWGNPPPIGVKDRRIHLPLASDIAAASSDMLFGQEISVDWHPDDPKQHPAQDTMTEILDDSAWQTLLAEAGEVSSALGGVYLRAGWDQDVAAHPLISIVHADGALPTFRYGRLAEVTFWEVVEVRDQTIIRHTETHKPGLIQHQLWEGTSAKLGKLIPLTEHPSTADLPVTEDYIETGVDKLTVEYVPNIRPAQAWRRIPEARYLGRSDYGAVGVTGLFDAIDETWTSWMRDIRHGKSRLLASSSVLESLGIGNGTYFDFDREVYEAIRMPLGENPTVDGVVSAQQFAIRVEEHARTLRELTLAAVNSCGYSGSTFGLDTEVAKTATEVGAVRERTGGTRAKKIRYWIPALERFLGMFGDLNAALFGGDTGGLKPKVEFPAESGPSQLELAQTAQALKAAQAASTQTLVALVNPSWDEPDILEEVARILEENKPAPVLVADPFAEDEPEEPPTGEEPPEEE